MLLNEVTETYPLSPMQQHLLSGHMYDAHPGTDIEQIVVHLREAPDRSAVEQSWRRAIERHAVLRTSFRWNGLRQPRQEVHARVNLDIRWHDWRSLTPEEMEQEWSVLLAQQRRREFRLDMAPLWRVAVVRTSDCGYRLLFEFHQILLDRAGLVALLTEALDFDDLPNLPCAPPAPYRGYIEWLESRNRHATGLFWRETLKGFTRPTALPDAIASQGVSDPRDAAPHREERITLAAEQTQRLRELARSNRCNMNTIVFGAWAILLSRYSGDDDVMFGVVRGGRQAPITGIRSMVGHVANTVPLRVSAPSGRPLREWLGHVRDRWTALRHHDHASLSDIRSWSDMPCKLPLFHTVVSCREPNRGSAIQAKGGRSSLGFVRHTQPEHPMTLEAVGGPELDLSVLYSPLSVSGEAVRRMLGHLATLLHGMTAEPDAPLCGLPLLTEAEREQILIDWNRTEAVFPDDRCVHELFEDQAVRAPDSLAVADEHRRLTYGQLDALADTLASKLRAAGVGPDACVAVCLPRSVEFVIAILAVLKAGGAYVPLDPGIPHERLVHMAEDARAVAVLTRPPLAKPFKASRLPVMNVDEFPASRSGDQPISQNGNTPQDRPATRNLAYVIYTSGSTGRPKGVAVEHRSLLNLVDWHRRITQLTAADRATQLISPSFDPSILDVWPPLVCGASLHVPPGHVVKDAGLLVSWFKEKEITLTFLPTPLAEAVLDEPWPPGVAMRALLTGGDRLRTRPGHDFPCTVINNYGPAEATVVATCETVSPAPAGSPPPTIGKPISNTEVYVLDPHLQPVPVGVPGELYIGGVGLARGYHHHPVLTAEKFVPHPFKADSRLYRTGDAVRWRSDGRLDFLGRLDHQIKIRGCRIEPGEIEVSLKAHPAVRSALVVLRDQGRAAQLVAYIVPAPGHPPPAAPELSGLLRGQLPNYMVPDSFVALEEWPLTSNGKIDRAQLPPPGTEARPATAPFIAPTGTVEETVVRVWEEVLCRGGVGTKDNFFELGGHSLRATQAVSRLNSLFPVRLTVRKLFENPTVIELARAIEVATGNGMVSAAPTLTRASRRRPTATSRPPVEPARQN